jgi:hypothetical protein
MENKKNSLIKKNLVISTYWKLVNAVKGALPHKEDVVKFAYYMGCAANEMDKGFKSLRKKKNLKEKSGQQPERIIIE